MRVPMFRETALQRKDPCVARALGWKGWVEGIIYLWGLPELGVPYWVLRIRESDYLGVEKRHPLFS